MHRLAGIAVFVACSICFNVSHADQSADASGRDEKVREAVERGLKIVQKAAASYPTHRKCFSCHHQTLPLLAMSAARDAGLAIDAELFQSQLEFSRKSFADRREQLQKGEGIGGRGATASYGLWTLEIANAKPDDLSADIVTYLLKTQAATGQWRPQSNRPPLEESSITCTVLSVYGMQKFAADAQHDSVEKSVAQALAWLKSAPVKSHEDNVMRLWGLHRLQSTEPEMAAARKSLVDSQRDDGGWSQLPDMQSDAYATGQAMWVLRENGETVEPAVLRRGIEFLLNTQQADGSWFVKSRSKPVQVFFDNGDPHGKDQFISIPATCWAITALAKTYRPAKPTH